ncbi:MAG: hypothetical protein ACOCXA_03880 [Planctomycetota bacterium]
MKSWSNMVMLTAGVLVLAACGSERTTSTMEVEDSLEVAVSVPESIRVGEQYTVIAEVTNESDHTLQDVRLRSVDTAMQTDQQRDQQQQGRQQQDRQQKQQMAQQEGTQEQGWYVGTLAPGQTKTVRRTMVAQQPGEQRLCWYAEYDPALCLTVMKIEPQLAVERSLMVEDKVIEAAYACQPVTVSYTLSNDGKAPFENATFSEQLPEGATVEGQDELKFNIDRLEPGDSITRTAKIEFDKRGVYDLQPEAQIGDSTVQLPEQTIRILKPELSVSLDGPNEAFVDQQVNYQLTIENRNDDPALNVQVDIQGLEQLKRISASGMQQDGSIRIGRIGANATRTIPIQGLAGEPGELDLQASVTAYCVQDTQKTVATTVQGVPALRLETIDLRDPVPVGETTAYEITLTNQGSARDVDVDISVSLPENLRFKTSTGPTQIDNEGEGRLTFGRLVDIPPGESRTWIIEAEAVQEGDSRLELELTSKDVRSPLIEHEPTRIIEAEAASR